MAGTVLAEQLVHHVPNRVHHFPFAERLVALCFKGEIALLYVSQSFDLLTTLMPAAT